MDERKKKRVSIEMKRESERASIYLKCVYLTFNLWKCVYQMRSNCKVEFDY